MNKKELLKYLRTSRVVLAYVQYSYGCGDHFQLVKSNFIKFVKESPNDTTFDIGITDNAIWVN